MKCRPQCAGLRHAVLTVCVILYQQSILLIVVLASVPRWRWNFYPSWIQQMTAARELTLLQWQWEVMCLIWLCRHLSSTTNQWSMHQQHHQLQQGRRSTQRFIIKLFTFLAIHFVLVDIPQIILPITCHLGHRTHLIISLLHPLHKSCHQLMTARL